MDEKLMKLNLQFFADGEDVGTGAEDVDTAEPQPNTDTDTSSETNADSAGNDNEQVENNQTGADFKNEINAGFAAARRQAEAKLKPGMQDMQNVLRISRIRLRGTQLNQKRITLML